jgi:hypothetical protein
MKTSMRKTVKLERNKFKTPENGKTCHVMD